MCAFESLYLVGVKTVILFLSKKRHFTYQFSWLGNISVLIFCIIQKPVFEQMCSIDVQFPLFIFQERKTVLLNENPQFTPHVALKMCSFDSSYLAAGKSVLFRKTRHRLPFESKSTLESKSTFYVAFESNAQFRLYILPHPKLCFEGRNDL